MASIFERTMAACQESKRSAAKGNAKLVKENVARKAKAKKLQEDIDEEIEDEVIDEPVEELVDEPATEEVADEEVPEAEGTTDEVMVVVDPEIDSEEYDEFVDELQDVVDGTAEGEVPTLDDYAGDFTYACPICGNTFFSETELSAGDACPVCGDTPEEFVLVGEVEDPAAVAEGEEGEEEVPAEEDVIDDDIAEEGEELEPEDAVEDEEVSDEEIAEEEDEELAESVETGLKLDEATFNPFLTKFVRSNYKNAKNFVVKEARLSDKGVLRLECKLTFKSGKAKDVTLLAKNFNAKKESLLLPAFERTDAFKVEKANKAKVAPFVFEAVVKEGVISCKGMKYNFITRIAENKRAQISGKLIKESK